MSHSNQYRAINAGTLVAIPSMSDDQPISPPPCLKLLVDCWEHILDYLSCRDICSLGATCKPMYQLAGHYLQECYPNLSIKLEASEISFDNNYQVNSRPDFYKFIRKLQITTEKEKKFILTTEIFLSLKMLTLVDIDSTETRLGYAQDVLKNIEILELYNCKITRNIFEKLAIDCPKLKYLNVYCYGMEDVVSSELFSQHYPQLEHFAFECPTKQINQLKEFLEKHSKLKRFSTKLEFLWANRNSLNETNVQLNMLKISFYKHPNVPFDEFVDFLKSLYKRSFYNELYLVIDETSDIDMNFSNAIYNLPTLQKLNVYTNTDIDFSRLTNLNELYVAEMAEGDLENMAKILVHLERLVIEEACIVEMLPFIFHSKKLKEFIVFDIFLDGNNHVLDLFTFNEERKKLVGACQISIGVKENIYLATKWRKKNSNLCHVKIARFDRFMENAMI